MYLRKTAPIKVAVRVRPLISTDRAHEVVCVNAFPYANQVVIGSQECFSVDHALPMDCTQSHVYDTAIYPMVDHLMEGHDTNIIAYGQTHSGKTYTILGPGVHCASSETEYGVIPRVTREVYNRLMQCNDREYQTRVSFVEVCDDTMRDLLSNEYRRELPILDEYKGAEVPGVQNILCRGISEVFNCLHVGMSNRNIGHPTVRPRTHCMFTLTVEQRWTIDGMVHHLYSNAKFLVLAGSELVLYNDNSYHMDSGLLALDSSIAYMTDCNWDHENRRQKSTLTTLLMDSIGGRSYTMFMCCISPASLNFDETLNSLRFVLRARSITNFPSLNAYDVRGVDDLMRGGPDTHSPPPRSFPEETYEVQESNEGSTNAYTFGLEFAANQWLKLVANAEGLFSQLVNNQYLSPEEREQVERWLCLKQECEECVGSDEAASVRELSGRPLERIDELTESEEKPDISLDLVNNCTNNIKKSPSDSESESDVDSQRPDFLDKLDDCMHKFKVETDNFVQANNYDSPDNDENVRNDVEEKRYVPRIIANRNCLSSRRKSIQPGSEIPNFFLLSQAEKAQRMPNIAIYHDNKEQDDEDDEVEEVVDQYDDQVGHIKQESEEDYDEEQDNGEEQDDGNENAMDETENTLNEEPRQPFDLTVKVKVEITQDQELVPMSSNEPYQELQLLSAGNEARQSQIRQVQVGMEGAQKRIEELQCTIQIKEQFIGDMNKNSDMRATAKQRFQRKRTKLEEEYYKTRSFLARAENALLFSDGKQKVKKEIEKYRTLAVHYEKRLKDIESIKQIAGDSARKVLELENSLQASKKQMQKMKKLLKKEEKHKLCLEQELLKDQRKIKDLEQKFNLQASKLNEKKVMPMEEGRMKWFQEEEERIASLRESSQKFQEELIQQQSSLDKREAFLKEKLGLNVKGTMEGDIYSHFIKVEDKGNREDIRHEIHNLRTTRDCLVDQRCDLDEKYQKDKSLSPVEERKLLECDEAIEAIDAAIEFKNELICGRKDDGINIVPGEKERGEELLVARLMNLSIVEMRAILYKYFQKVIDLRESGRKMEIQLADLDHKTDTQSWKIQALSNALQQNHFETERRVVVIQKEHEEKLHIMLRHFAEESSQSSGGGPETDLSQMKRENHHLRRRLHEMETLLQTASRAHRRQSRSISPITIPQQNLKQLQGPESPPTTKVTRQKNKLIIQQHKSSKYSKR